MADDTFAFSIVSILVGIVVSEQSLQQCSSFCVCDSWYGLQRASCTSRHLYSIDTGAPNDVQALDLSNNVISLLGNYELMDAGFVKLKYLNLSRNSINEIGLNAFGGLTNLTVLDLSSNHLYYILPDVFVNNHNLRTLKLARNNFNSHVPILQSSSLVELSLNGCRISHLPVDTFNGLRHVRRLDLSYNLMIQMSSMVLQPLHLLQKLSLEGNPWSCNKPMLDLQVHLENRNVEFRQVCGSKKPKKFEKMILAPERKPPKNFQPPTSNRSMETVTYTKSTSDLDKKNPSIGRNNEEEILGDAYAKDFTSFWLALIGFIAGLAIGIFVSYIWLTGAFRCNRRYRFRDPRLSLLIDSYLQVHYDTGRDFNLLEQRPDTPPPPYGEVMLRPNFYRYPSTASNLNDNATGYR